METSDTKSITTYHIKLFADNGEELDGGRLFTCRTAEEMGAAFDRVPQALGIARCDYCGDMYDESLLTQHAGSDRYCPECHADEAERDERCS